MIKPQNALPKNSPFATVRALCDMPDAAGIALMDKTNLRSSLMKSLRSLLLIGLLQGATATAAFAADGLAQVKSAGVFKIGTEGTYAPFSYHDESGKLAGFDVEIGTEIAKRLGVKPQFVEGKWDGLIAGLDVNRYD